MTPQLCVLTVSMELSFISKLCCETPFSLDCDQIIESVMYDMQLEQMKQGTLCQEFEPIPNKLAQNESQHGLSSVLRTVEALPTAQLRRTPAHILATATRLFPRRRQCCSRSCSTRFLVSIRTGEEKRKRNGQRSNLR